MHSAWTMAAPAAVRDRRGALQALDITDGQPAMTAERPYRAAMPAEQVLALMRDDVGTKLCPDAFVTFSGALPAQLAA